MAGSLSSQLLGELPPKPPATPILVRPKIYYPRAAVQIQALFDDQHGGFIPAAWDCIPRSVEVERNNARKADVCRVELDYKDFPLDPRALKDVLISAHLGAVPTVDFPLIPSPLNVRFIGRVDEPEASFGPDQERVRLEARDYTGIYTEFRAQTLFADQATGKPAPILAAQTLQTMVETIRLEVTPETGPAVFYDLNAAGSLVAGRLGRDFFTPDENDSAWDVLIKLCEIYGLVPVWNLDVLEIRTADQFATGAAQMMYGSNISRLTYHRSLKQQKSRGVKIVCWNPVLGIPVEVIYFDPKNPVKQRLTPSGKPSTAKAIVKVAQYNVEGNYTPDDLLVLAKRVYEESAHKQLEGELETRDMTDLAGTDLLGLSNGDILTCGLDPGLESSIAGMSQAAAIRFLSNPGRPNALNPAAASALVQAWSLANNPAGVQFYINEAVHRWDREDGYRLTIKFQDLVLGV